MIDNEKAFGGNYDLSHKKPDKEHSILPTIHGLLGKLWYYEIIDVGCGTGEMSRRLGTETNIYVTGIDIVSEFIHEAEKIEIARGGINEYFVKDMREMSYMKFDKICAPFVINYLKSKELPDLFKRFSEIKHGRLVMTLDNPQTYNTINNQKFGAVKKIKKYVEDEPIEIDLYYKENIISSFTTYYHHPNHVKSLLLESGFKKVTFHQPEVSLLGKLKYGWKYWREYKENCDLIYLRALI